MEATGPQQNEQKMKKDVTEGDTWLIRQHVLANCEDRRSSTLIDPHKRD